MTELHPLQSEETVQGILEVMYRMDTFLREISGMDRFSFQPGSGSQAILAMASIVRAYHKDRGEDEKRNEIITTCFSHPSDQAAFAVKGYKIITIGFDRNGYPDMEQFRNAISERTAGFVVANPEDSGVYNRRVQEFTGLIHEAGIGGEPLETDSWKIDVVLGGSQKCLSAPPGLTFLSISAAAWKKVLERKSPVQGFYTNLANWKNWREEKAFPYTQPISDIFALDKAVDRLLGDMAAIERHRDLAGAVRKSLQTAGLELYPMSGYSSTVTSVVIPEGIRFEKLFNDMLEKHNIMIAGAFDFLTDKVFRIGHMGENCREEKLYITLKALNEVFTQNNIKLNCELHTTFAQSCK